MEIRIMKKAMYGFQKLFVPKQAYLLIPLFHPSTEHLPLLGTRHDRLRLAAGASGREEPQATGSLQVKGFPRAYCLPGPLLNVLRVSSC